MYLRDLEPDDLTSTELRSICEAVLDSHVDLLTFVLNPDSVRHALEHGGRQARIDALWKIRGAFRHPDAIRARRTKNKMRRLHGRRRLVIESQPAVAVSEPARKPIPVGRLAGNNGRGAFGKQHVSAAA